MIDVALRRNLSWAVSDALDAGEIDIAVITPHDNRDGAKRVSRSPLVWACAAHSDVDAQRPVPLAIFGPGCICRKAAISALDECGIPYRLAYENPGRAGLECAVSARLVVTVVPSDVNRMSCVEGIRISCLAG